MLTEEQKTIAQNYSAKALAEIDDPRKFTEIIKEFEVWKKKEGIKI